MNLGDGGNSEYGLIDCHAQILGLQNSEDEDNLGEIDPGKNIEEKKTRFLTARIQSTLRQTIHHRHGFTAAGRLRP